MYTVHYAGAQSDGAAVALGDITNTTVPKGSQMTKHTNGEDRELLLVVNFGKESVQYHQQSSLLE